MSFATAFGFRWVMWSAMEIMKYGRPILHHGHTRNQIIRWCAERVIGRSNIPYLRRAA